MEYMVIEENRLAIRKHANSQLETFWTLQVSHNPWWWTLSSNMILDEPYTSDRINDNYKFNKTASIDHPFIGFETQLVSVIGW